MVSQGHVGQQFDKYVGYAVQELANNHPGWTGEHQPLGYTEESVHPSTVRFQRYPASDERVRSAVRGYTSGEPVPPVVLVSRGGERLTADGHHRLSAAEVLDRPIPAVIAHSPRPDKYSGKAAIGDLRRSTDAGSQ